MNGRHRVLYAGSRLHTPVLERLAPARAAGFTALSIWPSDARGADLAELRAAIDAAGLTVTDVELVGNWLPAHAAVPDGPWRAIKWQTAAHVLPIAAALGAQCVSVAELFAVPFDGPDFACHFRELCRAAADHGLSVALEFVPTGGVRSLSEAWEVIERADCLNGGLMVDSWHFLRSGSSLDQLAGIPGDRILSVQLSDAPAVPDADLAKEMTNRLLPGEGAVDWPAFMQALAATGTFCPIGVEAFNAELDAQTTGFAMQACADALDACLALTDLTMEPLR
ncbi:sugar phosphate isomerase/epimerase [Novosphingobium sp.]|uniref:sugar phosphate isomerase/epimerase family protein n=1 Tax=Novosphingobium sp. TaxID=1874826 RepID=UPI002736FEE7|nr:sugar phosphate isomerase/epimerase [Novosphingobium sp.]MDP3907385.1 sugar phosphate isomerase/epimerase [Novosphingobium sp.]